MSINTAQNPHRIIRFSGEFHVKLSRELSFNQIHFIFIRYFSSRLNSSDNVSTFLNFTVITNSMKTFVMLMEKYDNISVSFIHGKFVVFLYLLVGWGKQEKRRKESEEREKAKVTNSQDFNEFWKCCRRAKAFIFPIWHE